ncbi:MAG: ATP-binding protein [Clostridium sp.]|nr:ATP-binding protein [Clostridium sp.]
MAGFQKAKKEKVWTKVLLGGASGSGKSYSALRLATGLAKKANSRIAAIDTEAGRIRYYANEFDFDDLQLEEPYTPQKYIDAINQAIDGDYKVLIIDSISHEWNYCVETHDKMPGNSYTNWQKITPMHNQFMEKVLQCPMHVIATVRGKDEYVLEEKNGKQTPKKVGLGYKQRDGVEYEYTVTFNIDQDTHVSSVSKDNTHIFEGRFEVLTEKDGEALYEWANSGEAPKPKPAPITKPEKKDDEDLTPLREEIIALAKELGGSKNPEVKALCEEKIGTINPNKSDDVTKLNELLDGLKKMKVGGNE